MSLSLPRKAWPAADQMMWDALRKQAGPFDDRGALAHLRQTSCDTLELRYARWLKWVKTTDPAALSLAPEERASLIRLQGWLEALAHTKPMSQLMYIDGVLRVLRAVDPDRDWTMQLRLQKGLKRNANRGDPARKRGRILSSAVLLKAGLAHADADPVIVPTALQRMIRQRDGTMIALLAQTPQERQIMTRVAIYARFSSAMQSEASIEDQLRICRERVQREGWTVTEIFTDMAISGASMRRPGVQRLMDEASRGNFDVIVAEALDRLSRDQADVATLFKRLTFHGVKIVTLSEGEISELHVGLKGTMNQLFLKDLAAKTHRGLRGRVEAGLTGGGNSYGYDVVQRLGEDGLPVTGERSINDDEAAVIRRIFADFSDGLSPKAIAKKLNTEYIPGPSGKSWRDTAIRGHRIRGTGLLNNELYIGRLIWNRLRYIKDPETGRRVSRLNPQEQWIITNVPDMRIVDDALWARVKQRQGEIDATPRVQAIRKTRFWEKTRAKHLLTGLLRCGCCGGGFASVGKDYLACSAARKQGTCTQNRSFKQGELEGVVLTLLRERLMRPDAVRAFITSVTREMNAGRAGESVERARLEAEQSKLVLRLDGLYEAIADGLRTTGLKIKLEELEAQRESIDAKLAKPKPSPVRLHPQLSEIYRRKVEELSGTLTDPDIRPKALDTIRGLIETVTIHETESGTQINLAGAITALVGLAQPEVGPIIGGCSVKVVAGVRHYRKRMNIVFNV